jgi:hypothetical protein
VPFKQEQIMKRIMIAFIAVAGFAAPALAGGPPSSPPAGGVAGTQNASPLAYERSFSPIAGASIFGGRSQGAFGEAQSAYVDSLNDQGIGYGQWLTDTWCGGGNCGAK